MKNIFMLAILLSTQAYAQFVEGAMDCTVTGNVVVASEEGKFKTYSAMQDGVKINEKLTLTYNVGIDSVYIALKRAQSDKNIVINSFLSTNDSGIVAEKVQGDGIILSHKQSERSISFLPDYIRIKEHKDFAISRYYKNDWHGIYSYVNPPDSFAHTLTFSCRHTNDKMDSAYKLFTGFKKQK
jgi:hypothetical protein